MKTEVSTAANFVTRLLRGTGLLAEEQLQQFRFSLEEALGGKKGLDMIFPLFRSQFNHTMVQILWYLSQLGFIFGLMHSITLLSTLHWTFASKYAIKTILGHFDRL